MSNQKAQARARAKYLYFNTEKTQKEIARISGISERNLSRWVTKEQWAQQKQSLYFSPEQELQHLYEQLRRINDVISNRKETDGIATKEELEMKTKLLTLITGHTKNDPGNWRNVAHEVDVTPAGETKQEEEGEHVETVAELKKRIGEEDFNNKYGRRFSPEKLDEYYTKVARMLVLADSTKKKYDAEGNYIANDGRGPKIPPYKWKKKEE